MRIVFSLYLQCDILPRQDLREKNQAPLKPESLGPHLVTFLWPYNPRALRPEVLEGPDPFLSTFKLPLVPLHGLFITCLLQKPLSFLGHEVTKAPRGTPREPKGSKGWGPSGAWALQLSGGCIPLSQALRQGTSTEIKQHVF